MSLKSDEAIASSREMGAITKLLSQRKLAATTEPLNHPDDQDQDESSQAIGEAYTEIDADTPDAVSITGSAAPVEIPTPSINADDLTGEILAALKSKGIEANSGSIKAAIGSMMTNDPEATVGQIVATAARVASREIAAESVAANAERSTREIVMAEPKMAYYTDEVRVVGINGWKMRIPAGKNVQVPKSVFELLQASESKMRDVKQMQENALRRLLQMPSTAQDDELREGYDLLS